MPLGIGLKFIASTWDQLENAVLAKRFSKTNVFLRGYHYAKQFSTNSRFYDSRILNLENHKIATFVLAFALNNQNIQL